jgi:hypothetical protein
VKIQARLQIDPAFVEHLVRLFDVVKGAIEAGPNALTMKMASPEKLPVDPASARTAAAAQAESTAAIAIEADSVPG